MTVKAVGYPIGLTIDTVTGAISGRPLPPEIVADLTGLTLDSSVGGVPTWSPSTVVMTYQGFGLVAAGCHQWRYRLDDGTYTKAVILTYNPITGESSIQALTSVTANAATTSCWYWWSRTNLNPLGSYSTPYTTSTVIGPGTVTPATVATKLIPAELAPLPTPDWFAYWDLTTAAALPLLSPSGAGPFTYVGGHTGATFSPTDSAWLFDQVSGTEWLGCAGVTPTTTDKLSIGLLVKNLEATPALPIIEVGPAFENIENSLSGNAVATYFYTPSVNETFAASQILSDNAWHWVVMTVDYTTKVVKLYVDGQLHATLNSAYAHASISIGSVFIHAWDNQNCLIKKVFAAKTVLSALEVAAFSAYDLRWIGAWDMEGAGRPNLVTGALGGNFNMSGFSGYTLSAAVAGGPLTSTVCIELPSNAGASYGHGAALSAAQTLNAFTMCGWMKGDAAGHSPNMRIFPAVNVSAGSVALTIGLNNLYIGGTSYPVTMEPADTLWHHYAVTWNGATGETTVYVDGAVVWTGTTLVGTVDCGWCGFDAATVELNGFGDNFALHRDVLPAFRIAQLAAGKMPDANGLLPEASPAIPLEIKAINAFGNDTKTLQVTPHDPRVLYRYWRIEITGPSIGGAFGGLVVNEIEGYESADGSGQNVFGASVGSTCTSTGGYMGTPGYTGDGAASVAVDGNTADSASGTYTAIGTVIGQYFQIDCLVPRDIKLSKIFHTTGTQQVGVKLRASQDGITWVDKSAEVNVGASGRPTLLPAI